MAHVDLDMTSEPLTPARPGTQEALLDAAEALFSERGYAAVGVREIVERAGANIAAVNYHFGSKSGLYLATVRRAMQRRESDSIWGALRPLGGDRRAGAAALVRFVRAFLAHLTQSGQAGGACSLLIREAAEPSEAVDAVVRDFIRPYQQALLAVIAAVNPAVPSAERLLHAESIMGQMLHYRVFRPFIARLGVCNLDEADEVARVADHIAAVALRGLRCEDTLIESALRSTDGNDEERATS